MPVEGLRAFLEPLGYRLDWGTGAGRDRVSLAEAAAVGHGRAGDVPFPDDGEGLLVIETDGQASVADATMQDVTARLLAERFDGVSIWCETTGRGEYAGGHTADPPAPGVDPPGWYS